MTDDIFIYIIDLPPGIHEMVVPCFSGFTVYLDARDSQENRAVHYHHALMHIRNNDHERRNVASIETEAHRKPIRKTAPKCDSQREV